jgi:TolB-like protein/tetratricopeptide (TPR) repeat protein
MSHAGSDHTLALGACRLDPTRGLLLRDGEQVLLRPKAFALLSHLAANAGRVVSKSDLIEAVWPGVFVTEDSLTQAVRELRKALADESQQTIRTVARRGYLLSLPNSLAEAPQDQPTVAVLRFVNEGSASDEPLVDGFTEDLVNGLARFRTVSTLARNSSFAFASDGVPDWPALGRRLGADFLVRGRMRLTTDGLEAKVGLINASKGAVLWSETFSSKGTGIFDIQSEITHKIVNRLVTRLNDANLNGLSAKPTNSLAAYEMVLRGLVKLRGYRAEDNFAARSLFELAVAKDPDYALAHSYVALADLAIGGYGEAPAEVIAAAVDRADRAVCLAPEEPRCHRVLALTRLHAREHEAAEYHLRRSLDLNPYDADTMAQMGYLLTMRGKPFEALEWLDRAVRINPIHPDWYHYDRSMALYSAGDYAGALECLSKLSIKTPWRLTRLAACHAQIGNLDAARHLMAEIKRTAPNYSSMDFARHGVVFEQQADIDHFAEGVAKALAA